MENGIRLTGNQLKILAAVSMLLDHLGVVLFPQVSFLRVVGRLAFPIYAFMIAEGCRYTRHKARYFFQLFGLGVGCQLVYYVVSADTYLNILLTFSLSVLLIYLLQAAVSVKHGLMVAIGQLILFFAAVAGVGLLNKSLTIDYGFWGIMSPVFVSLPLKEGETEKFRVFLLGLGLLCLAIARGGAQWYALLSLPILLMYSGQRGKANMKYFFYIFYPVHLALLQGIAWLVN